MDKKIIFGIVVVSVMVFVASVFFPVPVGDSETDHSETGTNKTVVQFLPWQIEPAPGGSIHVFGLTLGESTLQEANVLYHGNAEVSLFVSPDGQYKIEGYFDKVVLGGFGSQMILDIDIPKEQQAAMYQRGTRVSSLGNGKKKVTLSADDLQSVLEAPVASLTYLTRARLDEELLVRRFGEPARRISEEKSSTTHWLYPKTGLDIALSEGGNAVLQYVPPVHFNKLMAPLLELDSK